MAEKLPFFDFSKARGPRRGPDVGRDPADDDDGGPKPLTVTALLAKIKTALSDSLPPKITIVGEISNLKLHSSGHLYFSLKDSGACINAAMFRQSASRLKFRPTDGMEVVVEGRVDVYEVRGQLQLYVESMTPKGAGALELAFRQLQQKLQAEGLFDPSHKVALPRFPRAIGVITSPTGAAVRDIGRTLARRWPAAPVYLLPVLVQGEGAAEDIAQAIALMDANAAKFGIDTIILARGGGSLEDLWAFNEEVVARAIFACRTPIICGVGHEVDVTIADWVADLRAPTPTGAAEMAVPERTDVQRQVAQLADRLTRCTEETLRQAKQSLDACLRSVVFRDPLHRLRTQTQRMDELSHRLAAATKEAAARSARRFEPLANRLASLHPARLREQAIGKLSDLLSRMRWALGGRSKREGDRLSAAQGRLMAAHPSHRLELASQKLDALGRHLEAMSYRSVLGRGFSVTRGSDGKILRNVTDAAPGDTIQTELHSGRIASQVQNIQPASDEPPTPIATKSPSAPTKTESPDSPPAPTVKKNRPAKHQTGGPTLFD